MEEELRAQIEAERREERKAPEVEPPRPAPAAQRPAAEKREFSASAVFSGGQSAKPQGKSSLFGP